MTVFRVRPRARVSAASAVVEAPGRVAVITAGSSGTHADCAPGAIRVGPSRPSSACRQAFSDASRSRAASQPRNPRSGTGGASAAVSAPAAYSWNSSRNTSGTDQPSSRMWWKVATRTCLSAASRSTMNRNSGGRSIANRRARSCSSTAAICRSCSCSSRPDRSVSVQGSSTVAAMACTSCPDLRWTNPARSAMCLATSAWQAARSSAASSGPVSSIAAWAL